MAFGLLSQQAFPGSATKVPPAASMVIEEQEEGIGAGREWLPATPAAGATLRY